MRAHQRPPLAAGIGRQDFEALSVEAVIAQRKAGALMHRLIVVDDRDLPFARAGDFRVGTGIVDQVEDIVLFGHAEVLSRSWFSVG